MNRDKRTLQNQIESIVKIRTRKMYLRMSEIDKKIIESVRNKKSAFVWRYLKKVSVANEWLS